MKKGRHRRFEEARSLKRAVEITVEPCPECGADPEEEHASWCLYESEELDEPEEADETGSSSHPATTEADQAEQNGVHDRAERGPAG